MSDYDLQNPPPYRRQGGYLWAPTKPKPVQPPQPPQKVEKSSNDNIDFSKNDVLNAYVPSVPEKKPTRNRKYRWDITDDTRDAYINGKIGWDEVQANPVVTYYPDDEDWDKMAEYHPGGASFFTNIYPRYTTKELRDLQEDYATDLREDMYPDWLEQRTANLAKKKKKNVPKLPKRGR